MRNEIAENIENRLIQNNYFFIDISVLKGSLPIKVFQYFHLYSAKSLVNRVEENEFVS